MIEPVTGAGYFRMPLADCAARLERWRRTHAWFAEKPDGLVVRPVPGSFEEGQQRLLPKTGNRQRELLWECADGWTAYLDSRFTSDAITAVGGLCSVAGGTGVVVGRRPAMTGKGMSLVFALFDGPETVRSIALTWEGGWGFHTFGEPLPFEETDRYLERRKANRFTEEMLERYCRELGIRPWDPDFYGSQGVLFTDLLSAKGSRR